MAINDHPDIRCASRQHRPEAAPKAAALIREPWDLPGHWWPYCAPCLQELANDPDPVFVDVVYLDPTRQRRPHPDQRTSWTAHNHQPFGTCPDCSDALNRAEPTQWRPDPTAWTDPAL